MKAPRDLSGAELVRFLRTLGYVSVNQEGSHVKMKAPNGQHVSIPLHRSLKTGLLSGILADVADHTSMSKGDLLKLLVEQR